MPILPKLEELHCTPAMIDLLERYEESHGEALHKTQGETSVTKEKASSSIHGCKAIIKDKNWNLFHAITLMTLERAIL